MNASQIAKWERTKAKGFWRFVLLWVLVFGGAMIVATSIFDYFSGPQGFILENLKIRAPIFLIAGFIGGVVLWFVGEYRYKRSAGSAS